MSEIEDIRQAGRELAEYLQRVKIFFDLLDDLMAIANKSGYFEWVNGNWEKVLGWTRQELLSSPWLHFVHPDDVEKTIAAAESMNADNLTNFENRYLCKDGKYIPLRWKTIKWNGHGTAFCIARTLEPINAN